MFIIRNKITYVRTLKKWFAYIETGDNIETVYCILVVTRFKHSILYSYMYSIPNMRGFLSSIWDRWACRHVLVIPILKSIYGQDTRLADHTSPLNLATRQLSSFCSSRMTGNSSQQPVARRNCDDRMFSVDIFYYWNDFFLHARESFNVMLFNSRSYN